MPSKLGPVSVTERLAYLARLGSDAEWGRPTEKTARAFWDLVGAELPYTLDDLLPRSKAKTPSSGVEYDDEAVLRVKQSIVIAFDYAV